MLPRQVYQGMIPLNMYYIYKGSSTNTDVLSTNCRQYEREREKTDEQIDRSFTKSNKKDKMIEREIKAGKDDGKKGLKSHFKTTFRIPSTSTFYPMC